MAPHPKGRCLMAAAPIKFRCFRCNQLLGVARSKAGAVVACPKCSVELIVPEPEETVTRPSTGESAPETGSTVKSTAPSLLTPAEERSGVVDAGLSLDFLDIRPEDIRVEPGIPVPAVAAA